MGLAQAGVNRLLTQFPFPVFLTFKRVRVCSEIFEGKHMKPLNHMQEYMRLIARQIYQEREARLNALLRPSR